MRSTNTYEWKQGLFHSKNYADERKKNKKDYCWVEIGCNVANKMHDAAKGRPVAYLFALETFRHKD